MSFNIKTVTAKFGFRLAAITLSEDGSISTSIQIGTVTEPEGEITFNPVATQGYYIPKEEADKLLLDAVEGLPLRDGVSAIIESHLREKGQLTI